MVSISQYLQRNPADKPFLFATGLECSYPVVTGPDGKDVRRDEYALTGHYDHWREDFALVRELDIDVLRYGPPYHKVHLGPDRFDWSFVDDTFGRLKEMGIVPIADLCHFGLPDWLQNFQNPEWPGHFARYARAFASRYPWVTLYTPVNEIFVTALFSASHGWWNERLKDDRAFVTAVKHMARATILAQQAILAQTPDSVFIQSEATSCFHATCPEARRRAQFLNERRFLSLDLCYGVDVSADMYRYLTDNGMTPDEYRWQMEHGRALVPWCVMGNDYYVSNEHMVPPGDQPLYGAGEVYGYYVITRDYFQRYNLPVMHTETNNLGNVEAVRWLRNMWLSMLKLKEDGVPIVGFTWYSLIDQVDWDTALREINYRQNPLGLYNIKREIRPVGEAYRDLVKQWKNIVPMMSRQLDDHRAAGQPGQGRGATDFWPASEKKDTSSDQQPSPKAKAHGRGAPGGRFSTKE